MWSRYFALLVIAALLRADFELSRKTQERTEPKVSYFKVHSSDTLRQQEWKERAIRNYVAAQNKQWRHWQEAMFEAKIP